MGHCIQLYEICHARSGDKRDIANVGLFVYDRALYEWVRDRVTADAVRAFFGLRGKVERFELANLGGFNFMLHEALGGGVSRSLMMDGHGKGFSSALLEMEIEAPPVVTTTVSEHANDAAS